MDPKQFGAFLSEERRAKNLTQKELAEKLGVTDKAISKWERGVCLPDVAKFDDIAAALGVTDVEVLRAKRLPPESEKETAPLLVSAFAVWYALRRTRNVRGVDRRGVCIYALVCAVLYLAFVIGYHYIMHLWLYGVDELFGVTRHAAGNWYDSINAQIPPWTPRWVLYWFLSLRFFDVGPFYGFVAAYIIYPVTKLLRIHRSAKRQTNG